MAIVILRVVTAFFAAMIFCLPQVRNRESRAFFIWSFVAVAGAFIAGLIELDRWSGFERDLAMIANAAFLAAMAHIAIRYVQKLRRERTG